MYCIRAAVPSSGVAKILKLRCSKLRREAGKMNDDKPVAEYVFDV